MEAANDTIVALATPPGAGGVAVVRLSGPQSLQIALALTGKTSITPRYAHYCAFKFEGQILDSGLVLYFPGPNSFTGESVVELQGHGGPVIVDAIVSAALKLGARMASPGEFSKRAFLNGKMDLAQAEAIADLIHATTKTAAIAAGQSLQGDFSARVEQINTAITELRMYVEAAIDFAEEEIDFLGNDAIKNRFTQIQRLFEALIKGTKLGVILQEGKQIAIIGAPNAGKSSLLNLWAGEQASIVTDIPGTTRDMVIREVSLKGVKCKLLDTAGLRETDDAVEKEGIARALASIKQADWVIHLQAMNDKPDNVISKALSLAGDKTLTVYNKIDLFHKEPGIIEDCAYISAKTGAGFEAMLDWLARHFNIEVSEGAFIARRRHLDLLERCETHLNGAKAYIATKTGELLAEELRLASLSLQEITGKYTSDDLLGKIFSNFCIGK